MDVDREDDDLDIGHVLVLEHLQLLLVLFFQARSRLLCNVLDALLDLSDNLFRAVGDRLKREECYAGASQ